MKRNWITILLLLCFALLLIGGSFLYQKMTAEPAEQIEPKVTEEPEDVSGESPEAEVPSPGPETVDAEGDTEKAADFAMKDRNGNEQKLSDFFGKPILINFWATWCGPCQMELPYFDEAFGKYQDQIQFLMLDLADGGYETREGCIAFTVDRGYSFPLYFDEMGEGALAYGVSAIPYTVAIDGSGRIVDTHLGSMSSAELQKLIDELISGS